MGNAVLSFGNLAQKLKDKIDRQIRLPGSYAGMPTWKPKAKTKTPVGEFRKR